MTQQTEIYPTRTKRVRRFQVGSNYLSRFFTACHQGERLRIVGWPDDAWVSGLQVDVCTNSLVLYVESDTFEPIAEGELIPSHPMQMSIIHGEDWDNER
jgi:hypothetical protein